MRQEEFNPYSIEGPEVNVDSTDVEQQEPEIRHSFFHFIGSFFLNGRIRMLIGTMVSLFGFYLILCFFSFLKNGDADQSTILTSSSIEIAKSANQVNNIAGSFGAKVSDTLITNGIGLSSFFIAIWLFLVGLDIFGIKKIKFFPITLSCLLLTCISSLLLGFFTLDINTFFLYGGTYGKYISLFLIGWVGYPGTLIIYFILIFALILLWYKAIKATINTAKKLIPRHKLVNIEEHNEDEPQKQTDKKSDKKLRNVHTVKSQPQKQTIAMEIEEPTSEPNDEENVKNKSSEIINDTPNNQNNESEPLEIGSDIRQAKPIEKAAVTNLPILDPTSELSSYKFPPISLLNKIEVKHRNVDIEEQEENKKRIIDTLNNYGIPIKKIEACVGPTVTLFEIIPADGVRISKIKNLEDDIALSLSALGIRIIAPIPGRGTIGIEVPNRDPQTVSMRAILESKKYQECKYELPMAIGCTISNDVFIADLCKMPHILVAGATGQGKSVGLNAIITSLIYKKHPAELKFVLIDPKMVEFSLYSKLEHHYLAKLPDEKDPIITDPMKVIATLKSLAVEMDNRYTLLKNARAKTIKEYNTKFVNRVLNPEKGHHFLPYIVVVVDEFCDLIMMAGKEVEMPIARIAQKARAVGIHMIIATQRPSTNVITGIIKANFPGRIAFRVTQMVDSRTILDCSGAQQLIGRGDMLFLAGGNMERIQCAFVDTPEIENIVDYIDNQVGYEEAYELPEYQDDENNTITAGSITDRDPLFDEAASFIICGQTASTSSLQRRYSIGYNRAGKIMDQMEAAGIVGPAQGGKPRQVLMDSIQLTQLLNN